MRHTVYDFLGRSPVATVAASMDLGEGCEVVIWENTEDRVRYEAPANHTFSLYLKGGKGTRRTDAGGVTGFPGAICIMPEGCGSEWEINASFRFVHLYLSDARLRGGFVRTHDCDARRLELTETTFVRNPRLAAPLSQLATATESGDVLYAESALVELFGALSSRSIAVRAGLAPHVLRRVDDWIDAHLNQKITLDDLANLADLSGYHFHRMFRLSRGRGIAFGTATAISTASLMFGRAQRHERSQIVRATFAFEGRKFQMRLPCVARDRAPFLGHGAACGPGAQSSFNGPTRRPDRSGLWIFKPESPDTLVPPLRRQGYRIWNFRPPNANVARTIWLLSCR